MEVDNTVPKSAMVIFAHPDDPEFSSAGTIARWVQAGCKATYVLLTSGNVGTDDLHLTGAELAEIREREQRAACAAVGVDDVIFLRHPDCQLEATLELRRELVGLLRRMRPEVVICGDPTTMFWGDGYINHPDHRAAGVVVLDAVFPSCSQRLLWPEMGEPHRVRAVYVAMSEQGNVLVDISATIEHKIAALRAHASQMGDWDPEARMREWAGESGKEAGLEYAERFRRMVINAPREEPSTEESEESKM
jgi:LmbE family N-acetylglucosaminyl deacetylase